MVGAGRFRLGRRLALEDRMEAVVVDYEGGYGRCVVHKLGPSLKGVASSPSHQVRSQGRLQFIT